MRMPSWSVAHALLHALEIVQALHVFQAFEQAAFLVTGQHENAYVAAGCFQ